MSLKSPWIFHRSSWIFLKAPCIKITSFFFFLKKCFGKKERLKAQQYANVPGDHESVFYAFQCSRHSIFSVIWSTLMGEGIAIICLCQITGKRGPWKIILAPEKCWKVLDFFPKSLYEPYTKLASWIPKCYQGVKDSERMNITCWVILIDTRNNWFVCQF